jgi:hypothetical protein
VCRTSYVDPWVIDRYFSDDTIRPTIEAIGRRFERDDPGDRDTVEAAASGFWRTTRNRRPHHETM